MASVFNPIANGKYRNEPCICGSGKKSKKCHGRDQYIPKESMSEYIDVILAHNLMIIKNSK